MLSLFLSQLAGGAAHRPEYHAEIEANALILPASKQAGRMSGSKHAALHSGYAAKGYRHEMGKPTFMMQARVAGLN